VDIKTLIAMYDSLYPAAREEVIRSDDPFGGRREEELALLAGGDAALRALRAHAWSAAQAASAAEPLSEGAKVLCQRGKHKGWYGIAEKSMPSTWGSGRAFLVRQTLPPHEALWIGEGSLVCSPYLMGERDNLTRLKEACEGAPLYERGTLVEVGGRRGVLVRPRVRSAHSPTMCAVHLEGDPKERYFLTYLVRAKADPGPLDPLAFRGGGK